MILATVSEATCRHQDNIPSGRNFNSTAVRSWRKWGISLDPPKLDTLLAFWFDSSNREYPRRGFLIFFGLPFAIEPPGDVPDFRDGISRQRQNHHNDPAGCEGYP